MSDDSVRTAVGGAGHHWEMVLITRPYGRMDRSTSAGHGMQEALVALQARAIPIIFVSDQGADELVALQAELGMRAPFVCGQGDVHVPCGYFGDESSTGWETMNTGGLRNAVAMLTALYRAQAPSVLVVGFGSDWSDLDVLTEVDAPVIVRRADGGQECLQRELPAAYVTHETGPAGWREAVLGWGS
jgi:predicted mannosyl-3-phosphoglycerate phosphatase (HAD superfamily)